MGKILAFSGKATSGKTTAARHLVQMGGPNKHWAIESFATPLKSMVLEQFQCYGLTADDLVHNKNKMLPIGDGITVRQLLIRVGRMYREIDKDYWVRRLMERVNKNLESGCDLVLIDDMRYANEYDMLKARGATLLRIERPGIPLIDDASETELDGHVFDHVVRNDGAIDDLYSRLGLLAEGCGLHELV